MCCCWGASESIKTLIEAYKFYYYACPPINMADNMRHVSPIESGTLATLKKDQLWEMF